MTNPNDRIFFRRVFESGDPEYPEPDNKGYIAYYECQNDDDDLENAKIFPYQGFLDWIKSKQIPDDQWGLKLRDFSNFYVWFNNKLDAQLFLADWY